MVAPLESRSREPLESRLAPAALSAVLDDPQRRIPELKQILSDAYESQRERFVDNEPIETLVRERSNTIDKVILAAWRDHASHLTDTADLIAVGGYGRAELHPHSDIDLMLLIEHELPPGADDEIARFLTFLWDIGLEVGHSVRTLDDCAVQAEKDLTVVTTLMETRLLAGPGHLFAELPARIAVDRLWSSADFFYAKVEEQTQRHHRYHDTAYNLEPNVKGSPGGLRDIQTITWIALRHLGATRLEELVEHDYLTEGQLRILLSGRSFLWRIRFGLHLLTGRREDRLLFDHQVKLAKMLGYEDASFTLAVEQLMQRYYRTVMELSRLNEMLLQQFEEAIVLGSDSPATALSANFQARNGYLEVIDENVFQREPSTLLEIFALLERNLDLKGVSARTIALIKQNLWLIDEEFRQNPRHHRLFLEIIKAPHGVTRTLKRMNTYGVLGLYIPPFGRIVGRMQYDLFHAYTVDQHTLFVIENLRRLSLPRFDEQLPQASTVMQQLDKPEVAYLAGLFHDIAKGRGGDHSELGAVDAEAFCLEHGMTRYEARLVAWLVRNHLLLSMTAQKKDVNDPSVINEFAEIVGDQAHLDYLYVVTVADVRATNTKIWNSWKDTLFWELYQGTKRALRRGEANPIDAEELIVETKAQAESLLMASGFVPTQWLDLWSTFSDEYFLRHRAEEVAWHASVLIRDGDRKSLLVDASNWIADGLTVLMVYAERQRRPFIRTTATLDDLGINVVDARIIPLSGDQTLHTYCILDASGQQIADGEPLEELKDRIRRALERDDPRPIKVNRRTPRQVRMFTTRVQVSISQERANQRTVIELVAGDRPGLLFQVGQVLFEHGVDLQNAKVATIGERAEDVFFVTTEDNEPLDEPLCAKLREALEKALSDQSSA